MTKKKFVFREIGKKEAIKVSEKKRVSETGLFEAKRVQEKKNGNLAQFLILMELQVRKQKLRVKDIKFLLYTVWN